MKDLGTLRYFFSCLLPRGYLLSLNPNIFPTFLKKFTFLILNKKNSPLELNLKYASSNGISLLDSTLYRTLVGRQVYLTITRDGIASNVHVVNQSIVSPTIVYFETVLCSLCYLLEVQFQSLLFLSSSSLRLCTYLNSNRVGDSAIVSLPQFFVSFSEILYFLVKVRNKILYPTLLQNTCIVLGHLPQLKQFGCDGYFWI